MYSRSLAYLIGSFLGIIALVVTIQVNAQNYTSDPRGACQKLSQYCDQAVSINTQAEKLLSDNGYRTRFGKPSVCYTYESACRKTGCLCTKEYRPVCGTDNKTYNNSCNAQCANVSVAYTGSCSTRRSSSSSSSSSSYSYSSSSSSYGSCICTMEYAPVCGVNGVTYSNKCHANCAGVAIAYNGACNTQTNCQPQGSCFGFTDCPSGTYCSGFPNYRCYANTCAITY